MSPAKDELSHFLSQPFTHLIIGGGTAGLVVAARLSENPACTVGVLEAGAAAFDDPVIDVPGRFGESLGGEYDWQFETTQQPGLGGRSLPFPRGKVLGGTSALNFMTWNRGCREDYDAWEALGCEGWGWEGLLPFFKKSESFHGPGAEHQAQHHSYYDADFHGTGGPLHTVYSTTYGASHQHWHSTLHKLGVQTNRSHFSGSNVGVWTSLTGVDPKKRERCYSANAYYRPVCDRKNLVLLTKAIAREVLLEQERGEWVAKGVRFMHGGEEQVVKTRGEVILCGGSVSSPQLLELSGIGNPEVLEAAGIKVKVDNPNVGENLQEHMMTAMVFEIDQSITTPEELRSDPNLAAVADEEYALNHTGPRTAIPSSVAYLPFSHFVPQDQLSDLASSLHAKRKTMSHRAHDKILSDRLTSKSPLGHIEFNFDVSNYNPNFQSLPGKKYATMLQMLQYPFSRGSIHIPRRKPGSSAPSTSDDKPLIDPQYYAGPGGEIDFQLMVASQAFADKICRTKPLSDIIVKRVYPPSEPTDHTPHPPPNSSSSSSSSSTTNGAAPTTTNGIAAAPAAEDFAPWVRASTITDWHPVGTCAMGRSPSARDGAVVDSRLRVYGTRGLRVCDASVMPLQIAAHIQASVYAVGEKGAQIMGEDWVVGGGGDD